MSKWTEMNESQKVKQLVDIGVPMAEAIKASKSGKASKVEITESESPLPFLSEAQNAKRKQIEQKIKENAGSKRLMEAYRSLGLTEEESKLACMVESRLLLSDEEMLKNLEFGK